MPEPTFSQAPRRSFLIPALIAIACIALAARVAVYFFPATTVNIAHLNTVVLPVRTVFKAKTIQDGVNQAQNTLLVASTVSVENQLRMPIFIDDFSLTLTDATGAEMVVKGVTKSELPNMLLTFPALTPLVENPLLRETSIDPAKSAQGTLLFSLPIPQSLWDARKSAVIKVALYHQNPVYQTIPKA